MANKFADPNDPVQYPGLMSTYPGMVRKASTRRSGTGTKSVMDLYMQTVTLALPVPMDDSPKIPPKTEHNDSNPNTQ